VNIGSIQTAPFSQMIRINGQNNTPSDTGASAITVPAALSSTEADPSSQANAIIQGINYIADQIKDYMYSDPPFFPAGHPQRTDMIKQIKLVGDTIKNSSVDPLLKQMAPDKGLAEHSGDKEISAALDRLFKVKDALVHDKTIPSGHTKPGTILNVQA